MDMQTGSSEVPSAGFSAAESLRPSSERASEPRRAPPALVKRRRILVVDDDVDACELTCEILESLGHEARGVNDAPEALTALQTFAADVALLDLTLPSMDGFELAQKIRAQHPGDLPRLIALSGRGEAQDRLKSEEAGFSKHLTKPVELERLAASVAEVAALPPRA